MRTKWYSKTCTRYLNIRFCSLLPHSALKVIVSVFSGLKNQSVEVLCPVGGWRFHIQYLVPTNKPSCYRQPGQKLFVKYSFKHLNTILLCIFCPILGFPWNSLFLEAVLLEMVSVHSKHVALFYSVCIGKTMLVVLNKSMFSCIIGNTMLHLDYWLTFLLH